MLSPHGEGANPGSEGLERGRLGGASSRHRVAEIDCGKVDRSARQVKRFAAEARLFVSKIKWLLEQPGPMRKKFHCGGTIFCGLCGARYPRPRSTDEVSLASVGPRHRVFDG